MPRERGPDESSYTFIMDKQLHQAVMKKADANRFAMSDLMRMHFQEFLDRPIEQSDKMVRKYLRQQMAPKAVTNGKRK